MSCDLYPLFHPSSIAIIGASADETKFSTLVVRVMDKMGYKGNIYLVNTNTNAIPGKKVYKQASDIPGAVDLAILFVPSRFVLSAIEDCANKGAKVAIIHGAGFAELGDEGRSQQDVIAQIAHASGMRVVGPNCMGITSPAVGINMVTAHAPLVNQGGVAFAGQSGWATEHVLIMGAERGLGFSSVVSCGNQADLSLADYLDYFGNSPETQVIGAYVEGFKDGKLFFNSAKKAALQKPVVIWKSGLTASGARFTQSHTGSLAGNGEMAKAVLSQVGVTEAVGIEDMMDTLVAFNSPYLPQGKRVGMIIGQGGVGVAGCDACEAAGLEVPQLPQNVQKELMDFLKQYLPPFAGISNPIDLVWTPMGKQEEICRRCIELMAPWVDAIICGIYLLEGDDHDRFAKFVGSMSNHIQKPILSVPPFGHVEQPFMRLSTKYGAPAFSSIERAVKALLRLVRRYEWLKNHR